MKRSIFLVIYNFFILVSVFSQSYNTEKTALSNFLIRMYKNAPYEVKIVEDYDNHYFVSAVMLDPAKYSGNENVMLRVASVKAMSQASRYFNGSSITADLVITTKEDAQGDADTEIVEKIKENSIGYVKQLEHISNFTNDEGKQVFIFLKQIE